MTRVFRTLYKLLPSIKNILGACRFFLSTFFHFHCTLFVRLRDPWRGSRNLYLKHSFSTYTCLSNNSLISAWISTKFVSTLLLCMLYKTNNFQHKASTLIHLRDTFTLHADSFHNLDPLNMI